MPETQEQLTLRRTQRWNAYVRTTGYLSPAIARSMDDPLIRAFDFVAWLMETRHQWCEHEGDPPCCDRGSRPPAYEKLPLPPSWEAPKQ